MKKAVILLSGGLDSATVAALAKSDGFSLFGLTVQYGQRHACELRAAKKIAKNLGFLEHKKFKLPLNQWGGSSLVKGGNDTIPMNRSFADMKREIPSTYVPGRNLLFLSLALSWAEVLVAEAIFLGVNQLDYSGYPDCRPEFIAAFEHLATLGTKMGVEKGRCPKIYTPLINLTKAEIIQKGTNLVDYSLTHSCYNPNSEAIACGQCDSCLIRLRGFEEAGIQDPIPYQRSRT